RNVAFSWNGLRRLGAVGLETFPREFQDGMRARARILGDDTAAWELGGTEQTEPDALLLIAADSAEALNREIARQLAGIAACGLEQIGCFDGHQLPHHLYLPEHFGFRDGRAQPEIRGFGDDTGGPDSMPAGEFLLGYSNADGQIFDGADWARDGSFLVFRKLHQKVFQFRRALHRGAPAAGLTPD